MGVEIYIMPKREIFIILIEEKELLFAFLSAILFLEINRETDLFFMFKNIPFLKNHRAFKMLALPAFLCIILGLTGCSGNISVSAGGTPTGGSTLRVGVRNNVSGFGYVNEETGRYSGLEIDIAEEMANRLGYNKIEYIAVTADTREDLLREGEVDCVLACFSISEEREEEFDFSPPYYQDASIVMVENSSLFTTLADLTGCTFGTVSGTNAASELIDKMKELGLTNGKTVSMDDGEGLVLDNFSIIQLPTHADLSEALEEGTIDAMCGDGCLLRSYLLTDRNILDIDIAKQEYAVATLKGSVLSEPIDEAIQGMLDDKTILQLIDKWD